MSDYNKEKIKDEIEKRKKEEYRLNKIKELLRESDFSFSAFQTIKHKEGWFSPGHNTAYIPSDLWKDEWILVVLPSWEEKDDHLDEIMEIVNKIECEMDVSIDIRFADND